MIILVTIGRIERFLFIIKTLYIVCPDVSLPVRSRRHTVYQRCPSPTSVNHVDLSSYNPVTAVFIQVVKLSYEADKSTHTVDVIFFVELKQDNRIHVKKKRQKTPGEWHTL